MDPAQARGIYQLMMITAWADGRLEMSETVMADALVGDVAEVGTVPDKAQLSARARERLEVLGLQGALQEAAAGLGEARHRELAFVCCARVLEADGIIAHEEFQVLSQLKFILGLRSEDVARLLRKS